LCEPAIVAETNPGLQLVAEEAAGFGEAAAVVGRATATVAVLAAGVVGVGAGAVVGGAVVAGAAPPSSHCATPPWCEHVPECVCEKL
jgi:hypothetical protein